MTFYVNVEGIKSEGRGKAGGNGWHDTDDMVEAIDLQLARFHRMWDELGHGGIVTYHIDIAGEASPRRTPQGKPLPLRDADE